MRVMGSLCALTYPRRVFKWYNGELKQDASEQEDNAEGVQGSPLPAPNFGAALLHAHNTYKTVSVFRENQLLSAANANNSENAGVRYANANNRGANTNANYGFPLYMPFRGYGSASQSHTR